MGKQRKCSLSLIGYSYYLNGKKLNKEEQIYDNSCLMRVVRAVLTNRKWPYIYLDTKKIKKIEPVSINTNYEIGPVNTKDRKEFEEIINQCIEMRCSEEAASKSTNIIRQLPINVVIELSDKLIQLGKKHAIYPSSRGGYNLKVSGYEDSSFDHYQERDSNVWD